MTPQTAVTGDGKPVTETTGTPTEAVDYWALNAVFGAGLTGVAALARRRPDVIEQSLSGRELPLLAAGTFALAKVVARERIGVWVREPFVAKEDGEQRPRGTGLRHAVGELLTCTRCMGAWSALGLVGLSVASPETGKLVTRVLALSAANDFLQAGFRVLTSAEESLSQDADNDGGTSG